MGKGTIVRIVIAVAVLSVVGYEFAAGLSHQWCEVTHAKATGWGYAIEAVCEDGITRSGSVGTDYYPDWVWWSPLWGRFRQPDIFAGYLWSMLAVAIGGLLWKPAGMLDPPERPYIDDLPRPTYQRTPL